MELNISFTTNDHAQIQMIGQFWKKDDLSLYRKTIQETVDKGAKRITLDLFRLSFVSSQGLGLFVTTFAELKKAGCALALARPKGCVKEMIELSGFDQFMTVEE